MSYILNIETATTVCSVSVSKGQELLALKELDNGYTHVENLHVFIQEVLNEALINFSDLKAIAISKGPGSYTGLRIGTSAAKGLAYALGIPLISVDTLQLMTVAAQKSEIKASYFCPMIDARRMEVYMAIYNTNLETLKPVEAFILDENSVSFFNSFDSICFFGNGMTKCKEILSSLKNVSFIDSVVPSAANMPHLAYQKFLDSDFESVAYFEPFYLKDFFIIDKNK